MPVLVGVGGEVISMLMAFKPKQKWTIGNGRQRILGDPSFSRINRERGAWRRRLRKTGSRDRSKTRRLASQGWRRVSEKPQRCVCWALQSEAGSGLQPRLFTAESSENRLGGGGGRGPPMKAGS